LRKLMPLVGEYRGRGTKTTYTLDPDYDRVR
jgi:hypothetical protein